MASFAVLVLDLVQVGAYSADGSNFGGPGSLVTFEGSRRKSLLRAPRSDLPPSGLRPLVALAHMWGVSVVTEGWSQIVPTVDPDVVVGLGLVQHASV